MIFLLPKLQAVYSRTCNTNTIRTFANQASLLDNLKLLKLKVAPRTKSACKMTLPDIGNVLPGIIKVPLLFEYYKESTGQRSAKSAI
ncbi:hypothetical protein CEXT_740441 [Caerostris extrusa]|uniref:Uncharacterized protein n=1 Tax=Caerostris extrusa TaxID=172846 RepID=A0AAV4YCI2_CAEEX|nr:hypothetical protein CEXT_740441 [Caerostris extrusa]